MKSKFLFCLFILPFLSCGEKNTAQEPVNPERFVLPGQAVIISAEEKDSIMQSLDELADLERAGSWFQGMALTESGLRENAGDYSGAVIAVYKELAYMYGYGLLKKEDIDACLYDILNARNEEEIIFTADAIFAFTNGQWSEASEILSRYFNRFDEPDSFESYLILVCALESADTYEGAGRQLSSAYKSIRARYAQFPEYWYRGARCFSGAASAEYAENCINISPEGPFAGECREILAVHSGLKTEDGSSIKTKNEIETVISQSINTGNAEFLDILMPLIGLPDNPYTVYATGALRALTSVPVFKDYFKKRASISAGRLAERLLYISRG